MAMQSYMHASKTKAMLQAGPGPCKLLRVGSPVVRAGKHKVGVTIVAMQLYTCWCSFPDLLLDIEMTTQAKNIPPFCSTAVLSCGNHQGFQGLELERVHHRRPQRSPHAQLCRKGDPGVSLCQQCVKGRENHECLFRGK